MPVPTPSVATSAATPPAGDPLVGDPSADDFGEIGVADPKLGPGSASLRKAKKLVTKLPPAKVDGSLAADAVTRVLRREMSAIRKCYEDAKKEDAKLGGGAIGVAFSIDTKGAVKDAKESGSTLKAGKVGACVTALVGKLTFPAAEGKDAKVTSSVDFAPVRSTVNGKDLADVTADDVKAALKELGWTDIVATPPKDGASPVVITAKKGDKTVTITFSPSKKGEKDKAVSEDAKKKLVEEGIVLDDGILLAIVIDKDKKAADDLLQVLVKTEDATAAK